MERRVQRGERVILVLLFLAGVAILFWPTPVDASIHPALTRILTTLHLHGAPDWFDYAFVEFSANVLLFMPAGAFVASLMPSTLWWSSGVIGLALSLTVEFSQAVWLSHRFASAEDLLANTLGALLAGALVVLARRTVLRGGNRESAAPSQCR